MNGDKVFLNDPIFFTNLEEPFSYQTYAIVESSLQVFATGPLAIAGLVSNTINIVIFYRQGIFSNSATVSLTALAVSDFLCCFFAMWGAVLGFMLHYVDQSEFKLEVIGTRAFTSVRPLNLTTQITCWITAFATFERCISVVLPFKVRTIFSPRRSLAVVITIFVGTFILYIPNYIEEKMVWEVNPANNVSFIGWTPTGLVDFKISMIWNYANPVALRFVSIFIVILCNAIIFWKVSLSQKFRKGNASIKSSKRDKTTTMVIDGKEQFSSKDEENLKTVSKKTNEGSSSSSKEMKLLRMITVVSVVFTICYTVYIIFTILYFLVWFWNIDYHWYVHFIAFGVTLFFQILNSSTNTIIYYNMSSRFREELQLWCRKSKI